MSTAAAIPSPTTPAGQKPIGQKRQAADFAMGQLRNSRTVPDRQVPLMTFGNPAQDGALSPYFVAVDFGDTRGVVRGTFDYLAHDPSKCQFTSHDGLQVAQGVPCPPLDAHTVRATMTMVVPTWTLAVGGAWMTGTFPSTATSTRRVGPWTTYDDGSSRDSASGVFHLDLVLWVVALACFCTVGVMVCCKAARDARSTRKVVQQGHKSDKDHVDGQRASRDEEEPLPAYST